MYTAINEFYIMVYRNSKYVLFSNVIFGGTYNFKVLKSDRREEVSVTIMCLYFLF